MEREKKEETIPLGNARLIKVVYFVDNTYFYFSKDKARS